MRPVRRQGRPSPGPLTTDELRAALGDPVLDPELLRRALTHRSYAYENGQIPTNERLEFLGDSVLGIVVTETLYLAHPDFSEGRLAKLRAAVVNARALAGERGDEAGGAAVVAAHGPGVQHLDGVDGAAEDVALEAGPDDLDLGELGHRLRRRLRPCPTARQRTGRRTARP